VTEPGDPREPGPLDFEPDARDRAPAGRPPAPAPAGPGPGRAPRPRPTVAAPGYVWVVGVAAAVLLVVLLAGTLRGGTQRGARGVPVGQTIPPFAVPLALSDLDGDANLARRSGEGAAGDRPACSVRGPLVLNGCALGEAGPFVLAFFATRGKGCVGELDALERARAQVPGVRFAAIAIRGQRSAVRKLIHEHGWRFPVGYDRDGALANAFGVQVCPQITFARAGGRVAETTFGSLGADGLTVRARRLAEG
jgi:hypothetical protein